LLDEFGEDAPAIYGAWCALVAVAATCSTRGVLSNSKGEPMKLSHIARKTGFPKEIFERLFEWATRENVGWLTPVPRQSPGNPPARDRQSPGEGSAIASENPAGSLHNITEPNITEPNITEPNITEPNITKGVPQQDPDESEILKDWNETLGKSARLTAKRAKAIKVRLGEQWWRENWREALGKIPDSPFLMGDNDTGWTANIDFFLKPDTVTKILEGKYDGKPSGSRGSRGQSSTGREFAAETF